MKHSILLVDDSHAKVEVLERMLQELGHHLVAACSGEEALERASEYDFSVVLLEVRLPGISGYEVAQRLRDDAAHDRVPVIFITGLADQEAHIFDGYSAGGVDYLVKPIDPAILRRKVEIFCALQEKEKLIEAQLSRIEAQKEQLEQQILELRALDEARMESEIRYRSLVTLSPQAIVVQVDGELVFYNPTAIQMLGSIDAESMYGRPFHTFVDGGDRERVAAWIETIARRGGRAEPVTCALQCHRKEQVRRHVELHACCILYDDVVGVQMAIQDVTDHKLLEDKLRRLSQMDGLTGAWNRRRFDEQLAKEWARLARAKSPLSLLMLDLDQFKGFNDAHGHLEGDACLQAAVEAMKACCARPADLVARYGGEEFAVLLPETDAEGAFHLGERIVQAVYLLDIPHPLNKEYGRATISCGVATAIPADLDGPEQLIQMADAALYKSKGAGGNCLAADGPGAASRASLG